MQKPQTHVFLYGICFLLLALADSLSTDYIIREGLGIELNPFVDTTSIMTLIFSPLHWIYFSVCCGAVAYAEFNRERISSQIASSKLILFLHTFPYFFIIVLVVAVVNNVGIVFGYGGFISWFVGFFGEWDSFGYFVSIILLAVIVFPWCEKYVVNRYVELAVYDNDK